MIILSIVIIVGWFCAAIVALSSSTIILWIHPELTYKVNEPVIETDKTYLLTDMEEYPEYNGDLVTILGERPDAPLGKAYYVSGKINKYLDWVYASKLDKRRISDGGQK